MRHVLYLHGRGSEPDTPPGDLVASCPWDADLLSPALTDAWLAAPFPGIVQRVDTWLDGSDLAIGHSFGAWLLLCAAVERMKRHVANPRLVLLAPLLGKAFNEETGRGYYAPRAKSVRTALGLESGRAHDGLVSCLRFIHAEEDDSSNLADAEELHSLGYSVTVVPGGHGLEHSVARTKIVGILRRLGEEVVLLATPGARRPARPGRPTP